MGSISFNYTRETPTTHPPTHPPTLSSSPPYLCVVADAWQGPFVEKKFRGRVPIGLCKRCLAVTWSDVGSPQSRNVDRTKQMHRDLCPSPPHTRRSRDEGLRWSELGMRGLWVLLTKASKHFGRRCPLVTRSDDESPQSRNVERTK